ncbi:unnamed protein product [Cyclocybe aegerita]|uniref:DUF6604 domain-containing protein n=1 Tax=Cyclocybe aegerita TaxID=1973307 RepID=A0A8S0VRP2_CYCAE|nr:unnamed protein product [Cyclocybe aegerita]
MERKAPLPESYYSTYRQYKETSTKILKWVIDTAREIRNRAYTQSNTTRRPRAQGNKSRNAPKKVQPPLDPDLSSSKCSLGLFLKLVKEIADSNLDISATYVALLELSIEQRKEIAAFYSPDADAAEANKSHQFAIHAYSQALAILKEARERSGVKEDDEVKDTLVLVATDDFALNGAIHHLTTMMEEEGFSVSAPVGSAENEWLRDNPAINPGGKAKKPCSFPLDEYELLPDNDLDSQGKKVKQVRDESREAQKCFLMDVNNIRKYCNQIWRTVVPIGTTSYVAASFVTNRAVQLVKQLEYDLVAEFPVLEDKDKGLASVFRPLLLEKPQGMTQEMFDALLDQTMFHTWTALETFSELLEKNKRPLLRDGHFGYFDPLADRERMSQHDKQLEDHCIMCNHWPDLILANELSKSWIGRRGLGQEFYTFCNNKPRTVTWALIFSCQMQADVVQARRRHLRYDLQVARNLARTVVNEYSSFLFDGVLYDDNMDLIARPHIRESLESIKFWVLGDPLQDIKYRYGWDKLSRQASQKDSLWLQNPWLTANVISEMMLDYFFSSTAVVGAGGFVQSTIQLWNMLKQTGYLTFAPSSSIVGQDTSSNKEHALLFDHLMDVLGDKVFSGPPPKSNFLKQWDIMMGVRPEEFAQGKRQYKKNASDSRRIRAHNEAGRGITPEVSDAWALHEADYFASTLTSSVQRKRIDQAENKHNHPLAAMLDLVNTELGEPTPPAPVSRPAAHTAQTVSTGLRRGPLLNLNFLKVHSLCVRIFTALEPVLRPEIEQRVLGQPINHTQINWPYLTGWIARSEQVPQNGGLPDRVLLEKAADVVKRLAGEEMVEDYLLREVADESFIL